MARDYFQDIVPPNSDDHDRRSIPINVGKSEASPAPALASYEDPDEDNLDTPSPTPSAPAAAPERSIRNISVTRPRPRPLDDMRDRREVPPIGMGAPRPPRNRGRRWIWVIAIAAVVILGILLALALRSTSVTVTPRTHAVAFDDTTQFTAYPSDTNASGTLPYSVQTIDLEDSDIAQSSGTVHAEDKATGSITVYNNFSASPVKLIANTRFATPAGLVFRSPDAVTIPGKSGSTPGHITVAVMADQAGDQYNIGPVSRFTLPGLKSSPDMYAGVYAQSTASTTGGFLGDRPGVSPEMQQSTISGIRARLEEKAKTAISGVNSDASTAFPDLAVITYEDEPNTAEAGGSVRLHEKAHILIPVFPADQFAQTVADTVSANASGESVRLMPGAGFAAHLIQTASSTALGTDPIQFALSGSATIVWNVDSAQLAKALAGRDQGAFQTVVNGFPGIQEAHARIEPFWSKTFPKDPAAIKITVSAPNSQ